MAAQEQRHLERFDALMAERRVRPTALQPLWNVAGFALGAATALDVREGGDGLHRRGRDRDRPPLRPSSSTSSATTIPSLPPTSREFRAEELEHRDTARAAGATKALGYPLLDGGDPCRLQGGDRAVEADLRNRRRASPAVTAVKGRVR